MRPASARRSATGARSAKARRRKGRGAALPLGSSRALLIGLAAVVVIVIAVVLALTLPSGKKPADAANDAIPASAAQTAGAEAPGAEPTADPAAATDGQGAPQDGGEAPEAGADGLTSSDGEQSAAAIAAASDPAVAELIEKYNVLDNIPTTRDPLGLPESARVEDSYFDDAIFVGDSVTLKLRQYVLQERKSNEPTLLGASTFLAAQSFGSRNALREISENSIHPVINGVKMTLEDAIAQSGARKCYIMLGMNDVGVSGIEKAVDYMLQLLQRIQQKSPGIQIFVESATPRLSGTHPTTNQLFAYDVMLYDALVKLNDPTIHFVDVAYVMRDEEGKLYPDYCSDKDSMALHFTNAGCRAWIDYLYTHAAA